MKNWIERFKTEAKKLKNEILLSEYAAYVAITSDRLYKSKGDVCKCHILEAELLYRLSFYKTDLEEDKWKEINDIMQGGLAYHT